MKSIEKLDISITRRSAGIPYCILGVLNSENQRNTEQSLLPSTFQKLLELASRPVSQDSNQKLDLVQVHFILFFLSFMSFNFSFIFLFFFLLNNNDIFSFFFFRFMLLTSFVGFIETHHLD